LKLEKREKMDHGMNLVDQVFDFKKLYEKLNLVPQ
jgi:hypothetical protein